MAAGAHAESKADPQISDLEAAESAKSHAPLGVPHHAHPHVASPYAPAPYASPYAVTPGPYAPNYHAYGKPWNR